MDKVKAAKLKLEIATTFSRVISNLLKDTAKDGMPDGADTLMPVTIYALLQLKRE
jgi:hypothetical protein